MGDAPQRARSQSEAPPIGHSKPCTAAMSPWTDFASTSALPTENAASGLMFSARRSSGTKEIVALWVGLLSRRTSACTAKTSDSCGRARIFSAIQLAIDDANLIIE